MDKKREIQEKVNSTMELMDKLGTLESRPDFYNRVRKKIYDNEGSAESRHFNFFRNLKLQPVLITTILIINLFSTLFFILGSEAKRPNENKYQVYASMLLEANTIESNTYEQNIYKNITGEAE